MSRKLMFAILIALPLTGASLCALAQDSAPTTTPSARPSRFEHMLKKMDSNGDGKISLDEYLAAATQRFHAIDTQNKGSIDAADIAASPQMAHRDDMAAQRELQHMGAGANGSVTLDQYLAAAKARFAKLDTNGDGFLEADEIANRHHGHRQAQQNTN